MKVAVFNLGCKVNQYECDALAYGLKRRGVEVTEELEPADFYILNTCAVTREAERKSRQLVARCKRLNPDAGIAVCGCASQKSPEIFAEKDGVTFVSGVAGKGRLLDSIAGGGVRVEELPTRYEDDLAPSASRTRFYVKVQDGCDNFCSYCVIPYLRGRSRSRPKSSVAEECRRLSDEGVKEIVLTGINLAAYDDGDGLAGLLGALKGVKPRIRLGSLDACVADERFLDAACALEKFCPHFHLSLQSGDDGVLKAMNRRYTTAQYLNQVGLIRSRFPEAAVTTDLICGYPCEDGEAFENTLRFIKLVDFADMHIFPYSPREGTAAYKRYGERVVKAKERAEEAREQAEKMRLAYIKKFIGRPLEVLFEENGAASLGHSENYIKVYASADAFKSGQIGSVVPKKIYADGLSTEE